MPRARRLAVVAASLAAALAVLLHPAGRPRVAERQKEREPRVAIRGLNGSRPRVAVAPFDCAAASQGLEPLARELGDVVRADLEFEEAFDVLPPGPGAFVPGRQGEDGVVSGRIRLDEGTLHLEVRIHEAGARQPAFGREYVGPPRSLRLLAHFASDEILADQAGIRGVARSRLAFVSDRLGSFKDPTGSVRRVKEIFVSDYDGAGDRRVTTDGDLDLTPSWSPDRQAIAYTSYRRGYQDIFVARPDGPATVSSPAGRGKNWLPAWSPDGSKMAFTSNRDGNEEIYVAAADGSGPRRLTTNWAIDTSPAWSPDGARIAFTSNRSGSPQIWVMDADGANQRQLTSERYCDRPSWSPGPADEIAYVSRTKTGFDIEVIEPATGRVRQLTFGPLNESPTFSPNGRHIAFTSTRSGSQQIWTMTREGTGLRQVTHVGNNSMASWSR